MIAHHTPADTEMESDSEASTQVTLMGDVTEQKKDRSGDVTGQLLGGMEKVAGEVALHYLTRRDTTATDELFDGVWADYLCTRESL